MQHFTHIADLGVHGLASLLGHAARLKASAPHGILEGRVVALLFFNPSLRTRVSFETALLRQGGSAVVLSPGQDSWKLETQHGVRMDADRPEHIEDAIPVLSGYVDAIAVRCFASGGSRDDDEADRLLRQIRELASVPVISMESAREHPCQGLADMLTIREHFGSITGRKLTLSWAPHIKPLPLAVPHSFLLSAAACGAELTVAAPPGFALHPGVIEQAEGLAAQSGAVLHFTTDQVAACAAADVVYAKSWGPADAADAEQLLRQHSDWLVDLPLLQSGASHSRLMHCLPVRRNVEVGDSALDSPLSLVLPQAQNRYHVQLALLDRLLNGEADVA